MNLPCQDKYFRTFDKLAEFGEYHTDLDKQSEWKRLSVSSLQILPLDEELATELERFPYSSEDAIKDTMKNIGLAAVINSESGACIPIRDKAFKSLLDRAKINDTVLQRLPRVILADILNKCLGHHNKAEALLLCRNEKINAFLS